MKTKNLLALAAAAITLLVSGCAPASEDGHSEYTQNTETYDYVSRTYRGYSVYEYEVELKDGRKVICLEVGKGASCDWEGAKTSDSTSY